MYENQTVIVHVTNKMFGTPVTLHWHGMHQVNTPWMDGVAFITQVCLLAATARLDLNIVGPPMITVLKLKILFDKILGPSVFKLLSVPVSVCVSVCLCVCLFAGCTPQF